MNTDEIPFHYTCPHCGSHEAGASEGGAFCRTCGQTYTFAEWPNDTLVKELGPNSEAVIVKIGGETEEQELDRLKRAAALKEPLNDDITALVPQVGRDEALERQLSRVDTDAVAESVLGRPTAIVDNPVDNPVDTSATDSSETPAQTAPLVDNPPYIAPPNTPPRQDAVAAVRPPDDPFRPGPEFLSTKEAAAVLGVNPKALLARRASDKVPGQKAENGSWWFRREVVIQAKKLGVVDAPED